MTRPAGTPNKNKRGLKAQLKKEYGKDFDVIMMMAKNIIRMVELADTADVEDEFIQRKECVNSMEKLAQYVEPKLKAVEVSGEDGGPVITTIERVIVKA